MVPYYAPRVRNSEKFSESVATRRDSKRRVCAPVRSQQSCRGTSALMSLGQRGLPHECGSCRRLAVLRRSQNVLSRIISHGAIVRLLRSQLLLRFELPRERFHLVDRPLLRFEKSFH